MIFSFHHLKVDYEEWGKMVQSAFDFLELKHIFDGGRQAYLTDRDGMPSSSIIMTNLG